VFEWFSDVEDVEVEGGEMCCREMRRQNGAPSRRRGVTLAEFVVAAVGLGLVGAVVVPQFTNAGVVTAEDSLKQQLRTVRAAVELYRAQHKDALPNLGTGWTALTSRSDEDGGANGTTLFGPYLPKPPVNPLTGGSTVTASPQPGADWWWDASTGTLTALNRNGMSVDDLQ
jgi:type II secretory pathway pseudopilin PulG